MKTTGTGMALGTILFLLSCLCLPYLSTAYRPVDLFSINCGSSTNLSTQDGRNWIGDTNFLSERHDSVAAPPLTPTTIQGPYTSARLSHSQFTYSFLVTEGTPKFLRLFFYSTQYQNFDRSKAYFSVKTGQYTLLRDFNASLNADADADADPGRPDILFREYCITLEHGQMLNITFIPSTNNSYAFINGIEIVSMPPYLYYTNPDDNDNTRLPQIVGTTVTYSVKNNSALETMYRLNAGGPIVPSSEDTGMLRAWDTDDKFLNTRGEQSSEYGDKTKLNFTLISNFTAPDIVYRTVRSMGTDPSMNMRFNLTWNLTVDSGFTYLLRLYFCELNPRFNNPGDLRFQIFVDDMLATDLADVLLWTKQKGVPVVKQYEVIIPSNTKKTKLLLKMHPHLTSRILDAQVNAIEVFKISDNTGSLAGQNPDPPPQAPIDPIQSSNKKNSGSKKILALVTGTISGVVFLSFIVTFFLIKCKKRVCVDKGSNHNDGSCRRRGSSSLPTNLCRHFPIAEIKAATNNFNELFVVGVGGFGNVYKGYMDDDSTPVAIKRLKPGSHQGLNEFLNEIQMLSRLRHIHLVSLIGYCFESNEMILVYDYMDRGTLSDHLYRTDNPSLSWKQRLQICIGAARGLHYLHTGAKQLIIHRDVKSSNILLDEKWVAKVSDFGLSRIGPNGFSVTHVSTQVKGSLGYLDPEYYKRQRLTEKSDVYSFGVVLLEVLSGRQPLLRMVEKQQMSLVDWAKRCYDNGSLGEVVDPKIKGQITSQCLRRFGDIALSCLLEDGTQRPSMNDVVGMLEFVLQLHDTAINGWDNEEREEMFSSTNSSLQLSDYSSGLITKTNDSCGSKKSDSSRLIPDDVFSQIKDPQGR